MSSVVLIMALHQKLVAAGPIGAKNLQSLRDRGHNRLCYDGPGVRLLMHKMDCHLGEI